MNPTDRAILEAKAIHKNYGSGKGQTRVLRGIDLEIHRGEILSIAGRSGVGKSTLLNVLGLLDIPTSGNLLYHGRNERYVSRDLAALPLRDRARIRNSEIGFVFQFYHLLPDLTVLENVSLPTLLWSDRSGSHRPGREEAMELLERVGVPHKAKSPPNELSGGERQRVAIARALVNRPEIVYCDEPTGNLDTETAGSIHELILELNHERDVAFVIVTHDEALAGLALIAKGGGRKLIMRDGVFVAGP